MKRLLASFLFFAALAAHAQIATGSATVGAGGNTVFPPRIYKAPGLVQIRNGNLSTVRRELGPVMGFVNGENRSYGPVGSYVSPLDGARTTWAENDTWTYIGEIFMERGKRYTFGSHIDDYASITINGTEILSQPGCQFNTGSFFCAKEGWYPITIRVWDEGGIGYGNREWDLGLAWNTNYATAKGSLTWKQLTDPGDGTLFRTEVTNSGVRVSAQMRESDPTVMDVTYIVYTDPETTPTVNVRALAFEDGERSFSKVIRPETFIEGTDANIGDGISANVEHHLAWRVSSDWAIDLAKVKFEILAMKPGDLLLPGMHFVTIPPFDGHPKKIVSVNSIDINMEGGTIDLDLDWYFAGYNSTFVCPPVFEAFFWLYADTGSDLNLSEGVLTTGDGVLLAGGDWNLFSRRSYDPEDDSDDEIFKRHYFPIQYILQKMGCQLLSRTDLEWITAARLNWTTEYVEGVPIETRVYAEKMAEE